MGSLRLRVYAREVVEGKYPNGLAYSVHEAIVKDGVERAIHNEYGILFPKGSLDEENRIVPAFTRNIRVCEAGEGKGFRYVITGAKVGPDGEPADVVTEDHGIESDKECRGDSAQECRGDSARECGKDLGTEHCGKSDYACERGYYVWSTDDFISYDEWGYVKESELEERAGCSVERLREADAVEITEEQAEKIRHEWDPITCRDVEKVTEDGRRVRVIYSDGSVHEKDLEEYPSLKYPLAKGFGDPVVLLWDDEYYFIATNDNVGDIGFYVRKAHTLDGLFAQDVKMHIILDKDERRQLIQTFWAPEFHVIGGELYILFAVSNEQWGPQSHIMKLKKGGDILKAEDWEDPVMIRRADGGKIGEHGITLDMTYVKSGERHYYVWSYREHIGSPLDSGSMLMIAEFDAKDPYRLISEPECLSRPLYGFENTRGTINNEGPYAFYHDGKIYLAYSGGDARGYLYIVGMFTANDGDDLTDLSVWEKAKTPVLEFASVPGEYGPGHNSFFTDRNGDQWIAFHAVPSFEERGISSAIRRVHFDVNGKPRFDLAREEDLPEKYR